MQKNFLCLCIGRISTIKIAIAPKTKTLQIQCNPQENMWNTLQSEKVNKQSNKQKNRDSTISKRNLKIHQSKCKQENQRRMHDNP